MPCRYLKTNKIGEEAESDYPYKGSNGACEAKQSSEKVRSEQPLQSGYRESAGG